MYATLAYGQRGMTGDKTFKDRLPNEVFNQVSNASLMLVNEVDHDIIVSLREAVKEAQKLNNNNNNKKVKLNNKDSNYKMLDAENTKLNNENNKLRNELQMLEIEQMKLLEDAQKDAVTIKNYQNQETHSFFELKNTHTHT